MSVGELSPLPVWLMTTGTGEKCAPPSTLEAGGRDIPDPHQLQGLLDQTLLLSRSAHQSQYRYRRCRWAAPWTMGELCPFPIWRPVPQLSRPRPRVLTRPALTSTPSVLCWSTWRDLTCWPKVVGSPKHRAASGCPERVLVGAQYWMWSEIRDLHSDQWLFSEHLQAENYGQRGIRCDSLGHTAASMMIFFNSFLFILIFIHFIFFIRFS